MRGVGIMDPDSTLDWVWDWTRWLDGDAIVSHTLAATGVIVASSGHTVTSVTAWLTGAVPPAASVTCRITTANGRVDDRTLHLHVTHR